MGDNDLFYTKPMYQQINHVNQMLFNLIKSNIQNDADNAMALEGDQNIIKQKLSTADEIIEKTRKVLRQSTINLTLLNEVPEKITAGINAGKLKVTTQSQFSDFINNTGNIMLQTKELEFLYKKLNDNKLFLNFENTKPLVDEYIEYADVIKKTLNIYYELGDITAAPLIFSVASSNSALVVNARLTNILRALIGVVDKIYLLLQDAQYKSNVYST